MNDRNLRILRLVQIRQRELDNDSVDHTRRAAAVDRLQTLKRTAARTRARLAEAEARLLSK
jgi:hypothetical protein